MLLYDFFFFFVALSVTIMSDVICYHHNRNF